MKTNFIKAVRWEVRQEGKERFIQLYDEKGNEVEGKNVYWKGDFDCRYIQLTTLVGSPNSVTGAFCCDNNLLTSLEGSPEYVGGSFFCDNNQLTSLKGVKNEIY